MIRNGSAALASPRSGRPLDADADADALGVCPARRGAELEHFHTRLFRAARDVLEVASRHSSRIIRAPRFLPFSDSALPAHSSSCIDSTHTVIFAGVRANRFSIIALESLVYSLYLQS